MWLCPSCKKGELIRYQGDSISRNTKETQEKELFDEFNDFGEFGDGKEQLHVAIFNCNSTNCCQSVASVGLLTVERRYHEIDPVDEIDENYSTSTFFYPKFFFPNLEIFEIPTKCPKRVTDALNESFKLYFSSPKACANQARIALEELLNSLKVKKVFKTKKGTLKKLNLHERIESLEGNYSEFKNLIKAIKWLGNAGSHSKGELNYQNLLEAYEMFDHVLSEIYNPKLKRLNNKARKIIKKKGP